MRKYIAISIATACIISTVSADNLENIPMAKTYSMDAESTVTKVEKVPTKVVKKEVVKKAKKMAKKKAPKKVLSKAEKRIQKLEKKVKNLSKTLSKVKVHDAYDNIKFSVDFRNTLDNINYKYNSYKTKVKGKVQDWSGTERSNDALLSSRLYLNMKSKPTDKLTFYGQMAMYGTWGGSHLSHDGSLKDWSESSKATDAIFRIRQAYFVWADTFGDDGLPYNFSVGRRQSTDGFLANHRENYADPSSPLAHVTNMEVNGVMFKVNTDKYLTGSFVKFVYGRTHTGGIHTLNDVDGYRPYAQEESDIKENVDFFVFLSSLYNDGQYKLMFQNTTIFDTKGARTGTKTGAQLPDGEGKNKSLDSGTANLTALSLEVSGIGTEINDFLDNTISFASVAMTNYDPDSGHQLLGSPDSEKGYSYWIGTTIPDMITEDGRFGLEFNHGSQYWTPMTWAEDTAIGSKIATRGDAYEAYWNFNLFGAKNLASQIRYTHIQHDYTPNIRCSGWVAPKSVDIEADDIRFMISYRY